MADPLDQASTPTQIANLSETPESEPLADGTYELKVTAAKVAEVETKNGPRQAFKLTLVAEGKPDNDPVFSTIYLPYNGDSQDRQVQDTRRLKRVLAALGINISKDGFVAADAVNKVVTLDVSGRMFNGKRQVNVNWPRFE